MSFFCETLCNIKLPIRFVFWVLRFFFYFFFVTLTFLIPLFNILLLEKDVQFTIDTSVEPKSIWYFCEAIFQLSSKSIRGSFVVNKQESQYLGKLQRSVFVWEKRLLIPWLYPNTWLLSTSTYRDKVVLVSFLLLPCLGLRLWQCKDLVTWFFVDLWRIYSATIPPKYCCGNNWFHKVTRGLFKKVLEL